MQEGIGGWDPKYEGHLPWFVKAFVLYLLVAAAVLLFRVVKLTWGVLAMRRMGRQPGAGEQTRIQVLWHSCHARIASTRNLGMVTLILSLFVSAWDTSNILLGVSMEKVAGTAFLAGALSEVFATFAIGLCVCAALYACALFFESLLRKRSPKIKL